MSPDSSHYFLHGTNSSLFVNAPKGETPAIYYWGARLSDDADGQALMRLRARQGAQGGAFVEVPASLSCEVGAGYLGPSGLQIHRNGQNWAPLLTVASVIQTSESLNIKCRDSANGLSTNYHFTLDKPSDVISIKTCFENTGSAALTVDWAAVACIRVPPELTEIISFTGRWAGEFRTERAPIRQGGFLAENLRGRTSHDRFPGLVLCARETTEASGPCFGLHLGWSGNHRMRVDKLADGRCILQMGECLLPGELQLAAGETYDTPPLYAQYSPHGLSTMSGCFHEFYHATLKDTRVGDKPRPVHYNTWEGIYFNHSQKVVRKLASAAAEIGAERFVLDDGWFKARRHDQAGLGDWAVDKDIYPDGLQPIIDDVLSKGMEFGLWVEPEMINEDSELFRAHPNWILAAPPAPHIPFRHQFVIDLTRPEAAQNIFNQIDAILTEYSDISYLKWDMNRDLSHPGGADGAPAAHKQTHAVYTLIDRLRAQHPNVEIESCSSGGGRADYGMLSHTDRIWTSDSNDALDRQAIQRGASLFFPLSVIGAHVGPRDCHITGRVLSMGLRAATAMFGYMGVEADLLTMSYEDKTELKEAISLYKRQRELIHNGRFVRIDGPAWQNSVGVISKDRRHALFSHVRTDTTPEVLPEVFRFTGLDPDKTYRLRVIWPTRIVTPPPHRLETSGLLKEGYQMRGDLLMNAGLQLPLLAPETALIFELIA